MAFSIFADSDDIIHVTFFEEVDYNQRKTAVDQVVKQVLYCEKIRLLVDLSDFIDLMSLQEQEAFGLYLANTPALQNAKVASVTGLNHDGNIVVEAVAFTQGYQVVNFKHHQDAIAWLKGELN